jgi:oligogalacturonide lyase
MPGQTYPSEKKVFTDTKTGRQITRLTDEKSNNYHLYFTENSFVRGADQIIFFSDRASKREYHYNIFSMDLHSGEMIQLSDEPEADGDTVSIGHSCTKTKDGRYVFYVSGKRNCIRRFDTKTLESVVIYESDPAFSIGMMSLNASETRLGFARNEVVDIPYGANYSGFEETMYATKRSVLSVVGVDGSNPYDAFWDTHWMGHFQFAPDDDTIGTFCHEGPWNLVQQRIWIIDFMSRDVYPCMRQMKDDSVGHEFWTRDGLIFFDNRMAGHDGTITSSKTQAVVQAPEAGEKQTPYIGFADKRGKVLRTVDMPFYLNHYHANNDNTILVGDDVEDLCLIDISTGKATLQTLCFHGTSWYGQSTHCHPTFDWEGKNVLYTSDYGGKHGLYLIDTRQ